jgi:hypothetical protein
MKPHAFKPDAHSRDRLSTALTRPGPTTIIHVGKVTPQHSRGAGTRINRPLGKRGIDYRLDLTTGTFLEDIRQS